MISRTIDIHPHVISRDDARYPRSPLFGVQSDWSRERPVTIDDMIAAMNEAGVDKSAIVQASTCYGPAQGPAHRRLLGGFPRPRCGREPQALA